MDLSKYFIKAPLLPVIIQEKGTGQVLMLAFMNEESLEKTLETGYTWFFSRSRNELWNKGATSGNVQKVVRITADCDDDSLLIEVEQTGPACHTGNHSCFYDQGQVYETGSAGSNGSVPNKGLEGGRVQSAIEPAEIIRGLGSEASADGKAGADGGRKAGDRESKAGDRESALRTLYEVVSSRKESYSEDSYTCYLFEKGLDKILKKCGEECSEVIIAAKNKDKATNPQELKDAEDEVKNEICDLLYHLTVLMVNEEIALDEVYEILHQRGQKIGNLKTFNKTDHNT